jgi:hypothetical protein
MMPAGTTPEWIERMRSTPVSAVAAGLGHEVAPPRGSSGGAIYGCPACSAARRHTKTADKRGAVGLERSGAGFRCFQCDASGDALDFIAYSLRGRKLSELADVGKAEVRDWCQRWLGLDGSAPPPRAKTIARPEPIVEPEPPRYPPAREIGDIWAACVRADSDDEVASYLRARVSAPIDPVAVSDRDLARVVPAELELPPNIRYWHATGHRLIFPLFDAAGQMRSLVARRVRHGDSPKTYPFTGFDKRRLLMADGLARQLLAAGQQPAWWGTTPAIELYVCEGEIDYLTAVLGWSDAAEHAPGALGIESGSWSQAIADRIPDGSVLVIATDSDQAGDKYEAAIKKTVLARYVAGRIEVKRWRPT